ncbi:sensor histidine kinase [Dyadobacter sp. CY345]|uniref:sensor histidine kinase n=1 Tax=Dyadobacter sp. CY345 TaxID=2909335 RepID=UPI001F294CC9|nr:sensor histidine kinase [Dyadobacter sp. CY345]MCF2446404.1 sensor histidine kinase [Dyadobacter sp. CY345]
MKIRIIKVLSHIFFVSAFLALPYIFAPTGFPSFEEMQKNAHERTNLLSYLLMLAFFYFNYYVLIPNYYFAKKYFRYITIVLGFFCLLILFIHQLDRKPGILKPYPDRPPKVMRMEKPPGAFENSQTMFLFLVGVVVSLALRINDLLKKAEQEKLHTELSYLKAQINPHFLFNTLNSIYSLAIEKSDRTADAVVMLSSLMRYVIRDASESLVPLDKEIEYIQNYVSLQKLRLDDTVFINFQVSGSITSQKIAPLILISFIENAFKYGVNPEQKSLIEISIILENEMLDMRVLNNKVRFSSQEADYSGGIGLENTRTRLNFIYPSRHSLMILDNADNFTVDLKLNLA